MFTTENMRFPNFSLPKPIINYFLTMVNGNIMKKLHQSCKYFYFKNNFTMVDFLATSQCHKKKKLHRYGIEFPSTESDLTFVKNNIWLIRTLLISDFPRPSDIISKIVHCEIRQLSIFVDNVTMNEMKFLTKSGNVENLAISKQLFYSDGKKIPPEDLIVLVPNAHSIFLNAYTFSEETLKNLHKIERSTMISYLKWYRIPHEIDINLLCKFLEKHLEPGALFFAWFNDPDYCEQFGEKINEKMEKWELKDRPRNFRRVHIPD